MEDILQEFYKLDIQLHDNEGNIRKDTDVIAQIIKVLHGFDRTVYIQKFNNYKKLYRGE